jgi:GTPase involved in cell partitioning and DNA repair
MTVGFERERCNILRCLADMAWAEDEAEVEKNYHAAQEELRRYYDKLVDKLAEKERGKHI